MNININNIVATVSDVEAENFVCVTNIKNVKDLISDVFGDLVVESLGGPNRLEMGDVVRSRDTRDTSDTCNILRLVDTLTNLERSSLSKTFSETFSPTTTMLSHSASGKPRQTSADST
jgi:hypothetical protein